MTTTISLTEARKSFADFVNKATYGKEPVILTKRGEKIAALISMEDLQLMHQLEDFIDIEDAKKSLAEPGKNIPAEKFWAELRIKGL